MRSFIKFLVISTMISNNSFAVLDDIKGIFNSGDYETVRTKLTNPGGKTDYFKTAASHDEMLYMIASTKPDTSFDPELDKITHAIDFSVATVSLAARKTLEEKLWGFIENPDATEVRDDDLAKLVKGLLHLNTCATAMPKSQKTNDGLKLIQEVAANPGSSISPHANHWLGYIYDKGIGSIPRNVQSAIQYFRSSGMHIASIKALTSMGVSSTGMIRDEGDIAIDIVSGEMAPGEKTRKKIMKDIILPAYTENVQGSLKWRNCYYTCSNVWEGVSAMLVGSATIIAFVGGGIGSAPLGFVAGGLGVGALAAKGFAAYTYSESKENAANLAKLTQALKIRSLPDLTNATVEAQ